MIGAIHRAIAPSPFIVGIMRELREDWLDSSANDVAPTLHFLAQHLRPDVLPNNGERLGAALALAYEERPEYVEAPHNGPFVDFSAAPQCVGMRASTVRDLGASLAAAAALLRGQDAGAAVRALRAMGALDEKIETSEGGAGPLTGNGGRPIVTLPLNMPPAHALLDALGAGRRALAGALASVRGGGDGIPRGIGCGGIEAVPRAEPETLAELAGLAGPAARLAALAALADGRALVTDGDSIDHSSGPIVLARDVSGSTADSDGAGNSVACALLGVQHALLMAARAARRDVVVLRWSAAHVTGTTALPAVRGVTLARHGRFASRADAAAAYSVDGGDTDTGAALRASISVARHHSRAGQRADVLLVTDGGTNRATAELPPHPGVRVRALVVGFEDGRQLERLYGSRDAKRLGMQRSLAACDSVAFCKSRAPELVARALAQLAARALLGRA